MFKKAQQLSEYEPQLTRDDIIRCSRVLVIDDERPDLINDLKQEGFAVDHDPTGNDIAKVEKGLYDLVILDFSGVGTRYGKQQGLDLLRQVKRVNPAVFILAYTSKSLTSEQSDFYRLTDGTLTKDAGISESLAVIENALREAHSIDRLWKAVVKIGKFDASREKELTATLIKAIQKKNTESLYAKLSKTFGDAVRKTLIGSIVEHIIKLSLKGLLGT